VIKIQAGWKTVPGSGSFGLPLESLFRPRSPSRKVGASAFVNRWPFQYFHALNALLRCVKINCTAT
jgi:hypothetical protein